LKTPFKQALDYRSALTSDITIRTIVTSNFEAFWFYDLMTNEGIKGIPCAKDALEEIPNNLNLFKSLFGGDEVRKRFGILNPQYTEMAAREVADLYDALKKDVEKNPRFSEAKKKEFEEKIPLIVMRIVFLLFADNTSADVGKIFSSNQFTTFLEKSTDPAHFTRDLLELFRCLNIESEEERADELIPEELMGFPYVDGGLFEETVTFPSISEGAFGKIRDLERKFKQWDEINVSVFGPIMDRVFGEERRENGIYYTSRENILKVINPLFMDELRAEFEEIKGIREHEEKEEKLKAFHEKISRLQFFDPACGSGNFLTETYMELRDLEDEVIDLENSIHNLDKDVKVSLSQFHGIELKEYGAMVARTALQIAREQALERSYERFKDSVSAAPHFLPLKDEARGIICGNALTIDWNDLVTPSSNLYVFGNPPYSGINVQNDEQRKEMEVIFGDRPHSKLDYCAAWYYKAAKFLNHSGASFSFLSTNSVTQGAQVPQLFAPIMDMG
ncbi:MAG: class I SAM-dependent DNA methyltransferase, partial [Aeriscardovia sp.]|nr:class I SAM-dependent DNA methyltransferase [Aeriscardovia sp.]